MTTKIIVRKHTLSNTINLKLVKKVHKQDRQVETYKPRNNVVSKFINFKRNSLTFKPAKQYDYKKFKKFDRQAVRDYA